MVTLLESLREWLDRQRDVRVVAIFGSRARALAGLGQVADQYSDVDLQVVTTEPRRYKTRAWASELRGQDVIAYADRPAIGGVQKVTALFTGGEADLVIIPYRRLWLGRLAFNLGLHHHVGSVERALGDFSLVMRPGHLVLKGGPAWERFYARAAAEVPMAHLSDEEAIALAEGAYVDATSILGKLSRGEFVAVQRWLHRSLVETNFRLMHELRHRRGQVTYPDGRRVEALLSPAELKQVRFEAGLNPDDLRAAILDAIDALRQLVAELTGRVPTWPELR